jgi:NAD(P)H-flavin reductase
VPGEYDISLLFYNKEHKDIFFQEELDELCAQSRGSLRVHYGLTTAPAGWTGLVMPLKDEDVTNLLPPPPLEEFMDGGKFFFIFFFFAWSEGFW